jgi:hypothetical protein
MHMSAWPHSMPDWVYRERIAAEHASRSVLREVEHRISKAIEPRHRRAVPGGGTRLYRARSKLNSPTTTKQPIAIISLFTNRRYSASFC